MAAPEAGPDNRNALRRAARERRKKAFMRFGRRIGPILTANFLQAFSFPPSAGVAGYAPIAEEADVMPLLDALHRRGHHIALPRVVRAGEPLRFLAWRPGDALSPGYHGIPEPDAGAAERNPAVVLVPVLAFDRFGTRLGYGGGFYDRTLAALRAVRQNLSVIGVAYSDQEVDRLPRGAHDQPLDWILTEQDARRLGGGREGA